MTHKKTGMAIVGVIALVAIAGCFGFYEHWRGTYDSIDTGDPINQIANCKKNDEEVTLVFHRTGCKACEKAEHVIVPGVRKARESGREVVVMNVSKMSKQDMSNIEAIVPPAFVNGHVPTPQIVKVKPDGMGGWQVEDQSSLTTLELKTLEQMLKD